MIRIANVNDAEQLNILNIEFNGEGEAGRFVMMILCLRLQKCM